MCDLFSWIEVRTNNYANKHLPMKKRRTIYFLDDAEAKAYAYKNRRPLGAVIGHSAITQVYNIDDGVHKESIVQVPEELALAINRGDLDQLIVAGFTGIDEKVREQLSLPIRFCKDSHGRWINTQVKTRRLYEETCMLAVGDTVILGEHGYPPKGGKNWNATMQQYVGCHATITTEANTKDRSDSWIIRVSGNQWKWRVQNLLVVKHGSNTYDPPVSGKKFIRKLPIKGSTNLGYMLSDTCI